MTIISIKFPDEKCRYFGYTDNHRGGCHVEGASPGKRMQELTAQGGGAHTGVGDAVMVGVVVVVSVLVGEGVVVAAGALGRATY